MQQLNTRKQTNEAKNLFRFLLALAATLILAQIFPILNKEDRQQIRNLESLHSAFQCAAAQDLLEIHRTRRNPSTTPLHRAHHVLEARDRARANLNLSTPSQVLLALRIRLNQPKAGNLLFSTWSVPIDRRGVQDLQTDIAACKRHPVALR